MVNAKELYEKMTRSKHGVFVLEEISHDDFLKKQLRFLELTLDEDPLIHTIEINDDYLNNKYLAYVAQHILGFEQVDVHMAGIDLWDCTDAEMIKAAEDMYLILYRNYDLLDGNVVIAGDEDYREKINLTFGVFRISKRIRDSLYGFLYLVELTNGRESRRYIGQKCFTAGRDWRTYNTSSEHVKKLLLGGWSARYQILGGLETKEELDDCENRYILNEWKSNSELSLNYSCVIHGKRVLKYDYLNSLNHDYSKRRKKYRRYY